MLLKILIAWCAASELVSELTTMQKENSQLSVKEQVSALKDFYFDKVVELLKTLQKRIV